PNSRHRKNWSDARHRIAWRNQHRLSARNGIEHSRSGLRVAGSSETHGVYLILVSALYKIFLETDLAIGCFDSRLNWLIAHRQNTRAQSEAVTNCARRLRKRLALG